MSRTDGLGEVSVIVPAYNAAQTIERTLRSVAAQTAPPLEVIVVDDGSTDGTLEVVRALRATLPNLRVVQQENGGVARARNAALSLARGEWIAPLDADDLWHPEKLERQLARAASAGENVDVVYCWSVDIDSADTVVDYRLDVDRYEGDVFAALVFSNFLANASLPLLRRAALQRIGGWDDGLRDRNAQGCEDWDTYLRLAERGDYALAPAFLVGYRQSPGAMSRDVAQMRRSYDLVMTRARQAHPELPASLFRWSRSAFEAYAGELLWQAGAWSQAIRAFGSATWADAGWLLRRSTRRKFRALLKSVLKRRASKEAFLPVQAPPKGRPFQELAALPIANETDGMAARHRRKRLLSLRIHRHPGLSGAGEGK